MRSAARALLAVSLRRLRQGICDHEVRLQYRLACRAGRRVWLLASSGEAATPALGDAVKAGSPAAAIVGWVLFSGVEHYTDRQTWAAAQHRHLVPDSEGPYGWIAGKCLLCCQSIHKPILLVCPERSHRKSTGRN